MKISSFCRPSGCSSWFRWRVLQIYRHKMQHFLATVALIEKRLPQPPALKTLAKQAFVKAPCFGKLHRCFWYKKPPMPTGLSQTTFFIIKVNTPPSPPLSMLDIKVRHNPGISQHWHGGGGGVTDTKSEVFKVFWKTLSGFLLMGFLQDGNKKRFKFSASLHIKNVFQKWFPPSEMTLFPFVCDPF